jgi:anti-sigma B factor antagonist
MQKGDRAMALGPRVDFETVQVGSHDVVVATGEIDLASAPRLEAALQAFAAQDVYLDLRRVDFMDSAGLKVLINERARLEDTGGALKLVVGEGPVIRLLELTGIRDAFELSDSIE